MTAKEKVLKVYPRAYVAMSDLFPPFFVCLPSGKPISFRDENEEAAWQNAAESLPPQPKPRVMTAADIDKLTEGFHECGTSLLPLPRLNPECGCMCGTIYNREGIPIIGNGRNGMRCTHADGNGRLQPVAPVEANSPEIPDSSTKEKQGGSACQYCSDYGCQSCAEPKPTLSTPAEREQICDEILEIMNVYHEQENSKYGVDTPGGLEHMGDVWNLFSKWEERLKVEAAKKKGQL